MRKGLLAVIFVLSLLTLPTIAGAMTLTLTDVDLSTWEFMGYTYNNAVGTSKGEYSGDPGYKWLGNSTYSGEDDYGKWWGMQIGWDFWGVDLTSPYAKEGSPGVSAGKLPSTYYDLSAYDTWEITLKNINNDHFMVNMWMNTGWTDSSWGQDDAYHQATWTWLKPGEQITLAIDLTALGTINGDASQGAGDERRSWVSAMGIAVGTNYYDGGDVNYNGDDFEVIATVVPEPTTMLLLGSLATGLFGVAGIRKKRS